MRIYHLRAFRSNNSLTVFRGEEDLLARGGVTIALDLVTPSFLGDFAPLVVKGKLGIALCHKDDNYNRQLGRSLALNRVNDANFKLSGYENEEVLYESVIDLNHREAIIISIKINKNTLKFKIFVDLC